MRRGTLSPVIASQRVLFCDNDLLAVNKLCGELTVQGAGESDKASLLDFLRREYPGLRPLHRLDFETSGVVVFARTKRAFDAVREAKFAGWRKVYRALIVGQLPHDAGEVRLPLPSRGEGMVPAITRYRVLGAFANSSLVEAEIGTGRYHQIRRHFAAIHHPLMLDHVYGLKHVNRVFTQEFHLRKFFLHAFSVDLPHPLTGEKLHIEAPLPRAFEEILKKLRSL